MQPCRSISKDILKIDLALEAERIVAAIREIVFNQLKRKGAVIAVSGGIDSSVVAFLCARALGKDRVLEVQYKGGAQKVVVPDSAVIVSYNPADRTVLKPGAPVFVISQPQPDGSLIAARVNVGLNGQAPPM